MASSSATRAGRLAPLFPARGINPCGIAQSERKCQFYQPRFGAPPMPPLLPDRAITRTGRTVSQAAQEEVAFLPGFRSIAPARKADGIIAPTKLSCGSWPQGNVMRRQGWLSAALIGAGIALWTVSDWGRSVSLVPERGPHTTRSGTGKHFRPGQPGTPRCTLSRGKLALSQVSPPAPDPRANTP